MKCRPVVEGRNRPSALGRLQGGRVWAMADQQTAHRRRLPRVQHPPDWSPALAALLQGLVREQLPRLRTEADRAALLANLICEAFGNFMGVVQVP
jgi:hypothetical protein